MINNTPTSHSHTNIAFIDGQNLYMGTTLASQNSWKVDLKRFRIYLEKKYKVATAYYYLGHIDNRHQSLYEYVQKAGFVLTFRKHNTAMASKKKGNVDTDIIFDIMRMVCRKKIPGRVILVSGDGDYKGLVDFLIEENKFEKILFPNTKFASSLYKSMSPQYYARLEDVKHKIGYKIQKSHKTSLGSFV